jgi:hypothetical protein
MRTLTKILETLGEHFPWAGWMYGAPVYPRPPWYPRPPKGAPLMDTAALVGCLQPGAPELPELQVQRRNLAEVVG